jgi:hypothetical protein
MPFPWLAHVPDARISELLDREDARGNDVLYGKASGS